MAEKNLLCSRLTCNADVKQFPESLENMHPTVCYHKKITLVFFDTRFLLFPISVYNFSHRIDHLSFGEEVPGIISPLDGTEKITFNSKSGLFPEVRAEGPVPE